MGHFLLFRLPFDHSAEFEKVVADCQGQCGIGGGLICGFFFTQGLLNLLQVFLGLHPTGKPELMIRFKQVNPANLAEIEPDRVIR